MKCTTPEISWHNRDPVLSVDVQSGSYENSKGETFWRVATGGADYHVLIWHLITAECNGDTVNYVTDLDRHQKAVNVVRFSPSKEILASGDDESIIILWRMKQGQDKLSSDTENKEQWISWKTLKGHLEDIYDISWSPDSNSLISGSVDNTAILWDIQKGRKIGILSDHKGFVQGVSWDPRNKYVCTISTDRQCHLIDIATKKVIQRVHKAKLPTPPGHPLEGKVTRLFYDDTFKSFFRRLTFSIDGSLIIVPSGIIESQGTSDNISNATIVFSRYNIKDPILVLPSNECTIAVKCCPVYFKLRKDGPVSMISLPYRMVFAVATQHSILIYDTQQTSLIAMISNIHYGRLNDVAWSSNGRFLIVSSSDGYCSIIHFEEGELGEIYDMNDSVDLKQETFQSFGKKSSNDATKSSVDVKSNVSVLNVDDSAMDIDLVQSNRITNYFSVNHNKQKSDQVAIEENVRQKVGDLQIQNKSSMDEETEDIQLVYNEESISDATKTEVRNTPPKINSIPIACHKTPKTPRRVQLITLSSPKELKK